MNAPTISQDTEAAQVSEAPLTPLDKLHAAMQAVHEGKKIKIKGRDYSQVATRVEAFRRQFGIEPEIVSHVIQVDESHVMMRAEIIFDGRIIAVGHAEENRKSGPVNKTSALENCETSAIGRALGNLGLHGGEYASAEETEKAVDEQRAHRQGMKVPRGPRGGRPQPAPDAFVLWWGDGDCYEFPKSKRGIEMWLHDCMSAVEADADSLMMNVKALEKLEEKAEELSKPDWKTQVDFIRDLITNPLEHEDEDLYRPDPNPVATGDPNFD
ncbi:MAG: hypothetical protein ACR2OV_00055 [Hyphomicrobiaceae bacterium]